MHMLREGKLQLKKQYIKIMKMEMYVAPELEVLEVLVEQGFAGSIDGPMGSGPGDSGEGWPV